MSGLGVIASDIPVDANEPSIAEPYQSLRAELLQIHTEDQKFRLELEEIRKNKPLDGVACTKELWEKIAVADAECLKRVKAILAKHGWLSQEQVGKEASRALFLVIQHADIATQQEYLPMIRQAVKEKKLSAELLPLLEDRVALRTGHKQIYGTQIGTSHKIEGYFVRPLEDPDNVDKRRAEVGLEPLAEYVKQCGIVWDVETYKRQLPELEAIQKMVRYSDGAKTHSSVGSAEIPEQNKQLQAELLAILKDDQQYRQKLEETQRQFGSDSIELKNLWEKIKEADAANLAKVTAILDSRGWLGPSDVGDRASSALFLVIQHAYLPVQQKCLPTMRAAVKEGKAQASSLALLEDRVAIGEGRRQIYGSQILVNPTTKQHYVAPLEDPDNVDKRRASVGLEPLADYVKKWNIVWVVEAYKKQLPELEILEKDQIKKPEEK